MGTWTDNSWVQNVVVWVLGDRDRSSCLRRKGQEKGISLVKGLEGEVHTELEEALGEQEWVWCVLSTDRTFRGPNGRKVTH